MTTARWQIISLLSKLSAIILGLFANIIVLRILTQEEWGVVSLALSVVGSVSVLHHLGISSGLNREIARNTTMQEAKTIILSALCMRFPISVLLGFGIFAASSYISNTIYSQSELLLPIRLLGLFVILDGFQDILSTSVGALKLFKRLFVFQVVLSVINVIALIIGVYSFGLLGFIYAKYVYAGTSLVIYGVVLIRYLKNTNIRIVEVSRYIRSIIGIGAAAFIQKIALLYWQKIPIILMGKLVSIGDIGLYGFVDYFTQRLTIFSDASTDVSVPVFMRSFIHDYQNFVREFTQNFWRVTGITIFFLVFGTLFFKEFLLITGLSKYENTQTIFMVMGFAMLFVSLINTIGVVFIAGNNRKHMIVSYVGMLVTTALLVVPCTTLWGVLGGAIAFAVGSCLGLLYYLFQLWHVHKIQVFMWEYVIILTPLLLLLCYSSSLVIRICSSILFLTCMILYIVAQYKRTIIQLIERFLLRVKRT